MHQIAPSSTLDNQAEPDLKVFQESIATWPEQREASRVAGETDFLF